MQIKIKQENIDNLQPGKLVVLKKKTLRNSLLAVSSTVYRSGKMGQPTGLFLLGGTSKDKLFEQIVAGSTGIELWKLASGYLTKQEYDFICKELEHLALLPIFIDDEPGLDGLIIIARICSLAESLQEKGECLKLIVIHAFGGCLPAADRKELQRLASSLSVAIVVVE